MPRKHQAPIEFRIKALSVPRGTDPKLYLRSLLTGIDSGELPRGVKVELFWRNPETKSGRSKNWQSDDFITAVSESNAGFASSLRAVIQRKLYDGVRHEAPAEMIVTKKRKTRKTSVRKRKSTVKRRRVGSPRKPVGVGRKRISRVQKLPSLPHVRAVAGRVRTPPLRDAKGRFASQKGK